MPPRNLGRLAVLFDGIQMACIESLLIYGQLNIYIYLIFVYMYILYTHTYIHLFCNAVSSNKNSNSDIPNHNSLMST